jgi:hypothetical protein
MACVNGVCSVCVCVCSASVCVVCSACVCCVCVTVTCRRCMAASKKVRLDVAAELQPSSDDAMGSS